MSVISVCWRCDSRHVGCHATCEKYLEARKRLDDAKAAALAAKKLEDSVRGVAAESARRTRGRSHSRAEL